MANAKSKHVVYLILYSTNFVKSSLLWKAACSSATHETKHFCFTNGLITMLSRCVHWAPSELHHPVQFTNHFKCYHPIYTYDLQ